MIIGIDATRATSPKKTGTQWYSYHLIQWLAKIDQKNKYLLYTKEPLKGSFNHLAQNCQNKVLIWPPKFFWTQLRLSYEMLVHSPQLLFVPSHAIPIFHPRRTVTTIHDIGFERFPESYTTSERIYLRFSTKFASQYALKIITPSLFTKNELIDCYKINPQKVSVVHHGYDSEHFCLISDQQKINHFLAKYKITKPYLLYIGRLEEKKNIVGLIKAFKILLGSKSSPRNMRLVLVGEPSFGYPKIRKVIARYNLKEQIIMTGWLDEEVLPYLLNAALVFVYPSFYEGFGIPILEAFACATPVVSSKVASLIEVAGQAALLVNPHKPFEIAQAVRNIIENKNLRESLRRKGLERIKEFSWEKSASETLQVLNSL